MIAIDRQQAEEFLQALDPDSDDHFTFQTFDDSDERKRNKQTDPSLLRVLHGSLARHFDELCALNERGAGIYVTVNETDLKGRTADNVKRIRANFVDLDGAPLDPILAAETPKPFIITETSPERWHAYWRPAPDLTRDSFTALQERLSSYFHSDKSIKDLPRVMRIPGFIHCKHEPFLSHIVQTNIEAEPVDWDAFLPKPEAPKPRRYDHTDDDRMPRQWDKLNQYALDALDSWVPTLYPRAKRSGRKWRVSSKDLGRDLEEDLSFTPEGIKDFGLHDMGDPHGGGRTAIGAIRERFNCDFKYAVTWLCQQLGEDFEDYWPQRGQRRPDKGNGQDYDSDVDDVEIEPEQPVPLNYVDLAAALVKREWLIDERIPMFNVTLLSGEGAVGKSIALLQLAAAVVLGKDWLGTLPQFGPVLYIAAEEDEDEIRRRLEDIALHFQSNRQTLVQNGLRVICFAGENALLAEPDRRDLIRPTRLFDRIKADAVALRPKLIVVDPVADVFGGKENDRGQTRMFCTLMRGLAIAAGAAVILSSHPSVAGVQSDSGLSGSTAWHNSVRARMYFKALKDAADPNMRVLEIKKNNYGPVTTKITVRWQLGVYVLQGKRAVDEEAIIARNADDLFLKLLRDFTKQGRNVSHKLGPTYAPALFAKAQDAKQANTFSKGLAEAMERLFRAERIRSVEEGPQSKVRSRIVEISNQHSNRVPTDDLDLPTASNHLSEDHEVYDQIPRNEGFQPDFSNQKKPNDFNSSYTPTDSPTRTGGRVSGEESTHPSGRGLSYATGSVGRAGRLEAGSNRPTAIVRVVADTPAETFCVACQQAGDVKRIVDSRFPGSKSETLHERCAETWFKKLHRDLHD